MVKLVELSREAQRSLSLNPPIWVAGVAVKGCRRDGRLCGEVIERGAAAGRSFERWWAARGLVSAASAGRDSRDRCGWRLDWTDAGIGAAAGFGLAVMLGAGLTITRKETTVAAS